MIVVLLQDAPFWNVWRLSINTEQSYELFEHTSFSLWESLKEIVFNWTWWIPEKEQAKLEEGLAEWKIMNEEN